jgi:hypothetical protein
MKHSLGQRKESDLVRGLMHRIDITEVTRIWGGLRYASRMTEDSKNDEWLGPKVY